MWRTWDDMLETEIVSRVRETKRLRTVCTVQVTPFDGYTTLSPRGIHKLNGRTQTFNIDNDIKKFAKGSIQLCAPYSQSVGARAPVNKIIKKTAQQQEQIFVHQYNGHNLATLFTINLFLLSTLALSLCRSFGLINLDAYPIVIIYPESK